MSAQEQVDRLEAYLATTKLRVGALGGAGDVAISRLEEMADVEKGTQDYLKGVQERVAKLRKVVATARDTVGPSDYMSKSTADYLRGMANGLILALHTIEGRSGTPDYIDSPEGETLQRASN
jgi:hypothetical protein